MEIEKLTTDLQGGKSPHHNNYGDDEEIFCDEAKRVIFFIKNRYTKQI